jgi:hypothetical protein
MTEVRLLRDEFAKGKHRDVNGLAKRLGRTRQALLSQANNLKLKALEFEKEQWPGFKCGRCGQSTLWSQMPADNAMALLVELKRWKQTHLLCGG